MTWCGAGYQAGHANRETDRHKGQARRAVKASEAMEEGTARPGGSTSPPSIATVSAYSPHPGVL